MGKPVIKLQQISDDRYLLGDFDDERIRIRMLDALGNIFSSDWSRDERFTRTSYLGSDSQVRVAPKKRVGEDWTSALVIELQLPQDGEDGFKLREAHPDIDVQISRPVMWIVDKDHGEASNAEYGLPSRVGVKSRQFREGWSLPYKWRTLSDDHEVSYEGRTNIDPNDGYDEEVFAPLWDLAQADVGDTIIQYEINGKWEDI